MVITLVLPSSLKKSRKCLMCLLLYLFWVTRMMIFSNCLQKRRVLSLPRKYLTSCRLHVVFTDAVGNGQQLLLPWQQDGLSQSARLLHCRQATAWTLRGSARALPFRRGKPHSGWGKPPRSFSWRSCRRWNRRRLWWCPAAAASLSS